MPPRRFLPPPDADAAVAGVRSGQHVLVANARMLRLLRERFAAVSETSSGGTTMVTALFKDWKGKGNPAR